MDNTLRTYPILEKKIVNVRIRSFALSFYIFIFYLIVLAATMPMSATFINIFFTLTAVVN